jgi:membrane protein implicated in regulation of membrane protease activity
MWLGTHHFDLPAWIGASLVALWIAKDLLTYPFMRHYYRPQPSERRIVGERGNALTTLGPHGFVRVHGEIWQAQQAGDARGEIAQGTQVRVRDVRGLLLFVEPE